MSEFDLNDSAENLENLENSENPENLGGQSPGVADLSAVPNPVNLGLSNSGDEVVPSLQGFHWKLVARNALVALLPRPWLWWTALGAILRLARPRWWLRLPLLPIPDERYWHFRMSTVYGQQSPGDPYIESVPDAKDVLSYLQWCRAMR